MVTRRNIVDTTMMRVKVLSFFVVVSSLAHFFLLVFKMVSEVLHEVSKEGEHLPKFRIPVGRSIRGLEDDGD